MVLFSAAVAANTVVSSAPIKNEITPAEFASFSLTITNKESQTQKYSLYSLQSGQGWNVDPFPLKDKVIELGPGESHTTTVRAKALQDLPPGIYFVHLTIQSDLGEEYTEELKIYLKAKDPLDYLPAIRVTTDMNEKINPKEPLAIKLFLENRNPLNLTDLKIRIETEIPEFQKEVFVELPPQGKKTVEFSIVPNPYTQPKEYTLFFVFESKGEAVKVIEQKIEVLSLLPPFEVTPAEERVYLKKFRTLTVKNTGNVDNTQIVKDPVSLWMLPIIRSEGKSEVIDGQRYLTWEVKLGSSESINIPVVINYRIFVYALLALLLFAGFYWYVQSPVSLTKTAVTTRGDEGTLSEIKITLELRNHSKKPIKNVAVTDIVPSIANVDKSLELGTLKPQETKYSKNGTKVIWSLAELDAHEHRLITYKIKAKLNILGTFSLPRAETEFERKKGQRRKAYSNIFRIGE
ncbi:hypothetical protein HY494_01800 [Candidatus Woesearchaeota archaeon]|nr:hypothetical protein [Candidatus Woesearchaeota archaeon]